jgi:hypothetical protein
VIQFQDLGNLFKPLLEVLDLLEMISQLDNRCGLEHPVRIDDQLSVLQRVDIALDEQQVGAGFNRQEARARHIDAVSILEVLNSGTSSGFKLKGDCLTECL